MDVPNGETRAIEIVPSVDYDIHIPDVSFNGDLKTRFFSYENYTTSIPATGQLATSNRVIGANGLNGTINYWASNVTVTGTQRTNEFSGSNSPSARAGGSRVDGIETVATYGNPIIIVVQNSGGAGTSDIHITINFYEQPASIIVP